MLNIKRREQKQKARVEAPYKRSKESLPVAEDIALCTKNFGNTYDMILAGAQRAKELLTGGTSKITGHKETVVAMLEIQENSLDKQKYLSMVGKRPAKKK